MHIDLEALERSIERWKPTLDALDPWRLLRPDEIDRLYVTRPRTPLRSLMQELLHGEDNTKCVLYGARGAGKTTELDRLSKVLHERFCIVSANLGDSLPEGSGTLAIIILLGAASLSALESWLTHPDAELTALIKADSSSWLARARSRFNDALKPLGMAAEQVAELVKAVAPLVALFEPTTAAGAAIAVGAVKAAPAISKVASRSRELLRRDKLLGRVEPGKEDEVNAVIAAVNSILSDLREASGRTPLIIAEGLDKLSDLKSIETAVADIDYLLKFESALILSGPIRLSFDLQSYEIHGQRQLSLHTLPNVPVLQVLPGEEPREGDEGVALLLELYQLRMAQLTNPDDQDRYPEEVLRRAARMSSGLVRDFLKLLRGAGVEAQKEGADAVTKDHMEATIRTQRQTMQRFLRDTDLDLLKQIAQRGVLPTSERADTLLYENFIVCYNNGDLLYTPHMLILDYVQKYAEPDP
ncbi:MAG: hypothetical protein CMH57_15880 [Myxococcales bacterium]|nr:hypothetical protein [Myxococcales bacterium]